MKSSNSEVNGVLGFFVDDFTSRDDVGLQKDVVDLLLQQLAVRHFLLRWSVLDDVAVRAVVVDSKIRLSFAMEELEADEMICHRIVRDRLNGRDVGQSPADFDFVFRILGRFRNSLDQVWNLREITEFQVPKTEDHHPGSVRNVKMNVKPLLAGSTLLESRVVDDSS